MPTPHPQQASSGWGGPHDPDSQRDVILTWSPRALQWGWALMGAAEKVQAEAVPACEWEALAGPLLSAAQASPLILPFCRSVNLLWPLAKGNPKVLAWGQGPPSPRGPRSLQPYLLPLVPAKYR